MKHYSVLLLDDDRANVLDVAEAEFPSTNSLIRLRTADSQRSAEKLLKEEFFNMALVDPNLDVDDDYNFDGNIVLEKLKTRRPSCARYILTNLSRHQDQKGTEPIVVMMHPIDGAAQGIVIKTDVVNSFHRLIGKKAKSWLLNPIEVNGADMVAKKLMELFARRHQKTATSITEDEIDFLVSKVFGQGEIWGLGDEQLGIHRIELNLIKRQGFSLAAVATATGYSKSGVPGILCVLKFAKPEYVEEELVRYSQYVRFRIGVHHRVELLGWHTADNFGVLCYNFAGQASLAELFLKAEPGFVDALTDLFSEKSWYDDKCEVHLAEHFNSHYGTNAFKVQERIRKVIAQFEKEFQGVQHKNQFSICGVTLNLPSDILDKAAFVGLSPGCVVHGDLHCDNVLVGKDNVPMLIDYRSVAYGPRCIDFATLESSVRMLSLLRLDADGNYSDDPRPDSVVIPEILQSAHFEALVWSSVWRSSLPNANCPDESWASASAHIAKLAKQNFTEDPVLREEEYAATCLMWALRLFKVEDMPTRILARLLVWMSELTGILRISGKLS